MSTIDGYRHQLVGYFGRLPVYRPLEDIDAGEFEFVATRGQLLLGGGSGEHPALVLNSPVCAVAVFLRDGERARVRADPAWQSAVDRFYHPDDVLEFCNWTVEDYHGFFEYCQSTSLPNPYHAELHEFGFEHWLMCSFGEFVFFAMPDLAKPLMDQLPNPYADIYHSHFNNILLPPPHMPTYANGGSAWKIALKEG